MIQSSFLDHVTLAPPNSILGVALECRRDTFPEKIDLTIGAYRDDSGRPYVLEVVREAERIIFEGRLDHEYLPQDGLADFNLASAKLLFGEHSPAIAQGCIATIQGISGTGSLRLGTDFLAQVMPGVACYFPEVTWPNHPTILEASHIPPKTYRYLDSTGCNLDFNGNLYTPSCLK